MTDEEHVLETLRRVQEHFEAGLSAHDKVGVLIMVCLGEGVDRGSDIVGLIARLGFDKRHVGMLLNHHIASLWSRTPDGRYSRITDSK